jgi:hypothetical protein
MNFYFCESCNKRITDADIAVGAGKNKKAKGVFCKDCAAGVNTMEFEALNDAEAHEVLSHTAAPPSRSAKRPISGPTPVSSRQRAAERVSSRTNNPAHAGPGPQTNWILIAAVAGASVGAIVLMILFSSGESKSSKTTARGPDLTEGTPVHPISEQPPVDAIVKESAKSEGALPKAAKAAEIPDKPAVVEAKPARSPDDIAADAFEAAMKKINALGEDKLTEREHIADEFLTQYPDSMQAARMRVTVQGWSAPKPPPAPAPAAPSAPTEKEAPVTAANDKETRFLFECSPETEQGLSCYADGTCEVAEVFGAKSRAWKASPIPDPPWHSTGMSVRVQGHAKDPVKITPNSWVRFACHLENGKNLMMHVIIGDGVYEIHQFNLPEKKWFWASFKLSDFSRDIRGGDAKPKTGAEFLSIAIMAGADKIPCTLHVEKFQLGEGPLPKE